MKFQDILYEVRNGVAWITINRPDKMNAFRGTTCDELINALNKAGYDKEIGAIVLDRRGRPRPSAPAATSRPMTATTTEGHVGLPMEELHAAIRNAPKPVIASVQGYAIGGGNVLATLCDLTLCSDKADFGQVGPKMGSVDPGYGTAFLSRVVGEKKAREIWYMCRRYTGRRPWRWASPTSACRMTSSTPKCKNGPKRSASAARPRSPSPSAASIWTPPIRPASPAWGCMR